MGRFRIDRAGFRSSWLASAGLICLVLGVASIPRYSNGMRTTDAREPVLASPDVSPIPPLSAGPIVDSSLSVGDSTVQRAQAKSIVIWKTQVGKGAVDIRQSTAECVSVNCDGDTAFLDAATGRARRRRRSTLCAEAADAPRADSARAYSISPFTAGIVRIHCLPLRSGGHGWSLQLRCGGKTELHHFGQLLVVGISDMELDDPGDLFVADRLAVVDAATGVLGASLRTYPGCTSIAYLEDSLVVGMINGFVIRIRLPESPPTPPI